MGGNIMFKPRSQWLTATAACALSAGLSLPAHAQGAADQGAVDELVVTAQRRAEPIRTVPIAISALNEEALSARSIGDLDEVTRFTPGARIEFGGLTPQYDRFTIRGLAASSSNPGIDPSAAVFLDGIYVARPEAAGIEFNDIERVEVLRGPQGTLYGQNSSTGAINVITRAPTDEWTGQVSARYGNYNERRVSGLISGPIAGDNVSLLLTGFRRLRDTVTENLGPGTGGDADNIDSYGGRVKLQIEPSEALTITLSADAQREDTAAGITDLLYVAGVRQDIFDRQIAHSPGEQIRRRLEGYSAIVDWEITDNLTLSSLTGQRSSDLITSVDVDFTAEVRDFSNHNQFQDQFSQEFRLVSDFGNGFDFVAGLYYFHSDTSIHTDLIILDSVPSLRSTLDFRYAQEADSYAGYANLTFRPSDPWRLAVGLRYNTEERTGVFRQVGTGAVYGSRPVLTNLSRDHEADGVTYSISAGYDLTESLALYAVHSTGAKSGGFNANSIASLALIDSVELQPEQATNYEAGLKWEFARGSLYISAYHMTFENLQVSSWNGLSFVTNNVAAATSTGVEIESRYDMTDELSVQMALSWNDARYDRYPNAPVPRVSGARQDLSGRRLALAPEWSGTVGVQYERPIGDLQVSARVDYIFEGRTSLSSTGDPFGARPAYDLVNTRFTIGPQDERFSVSLYGKNIFDTEYVEGFGAVGTLNAFMGIPGRARFYGVELLARF